MVRRPVSHPGCNDTPATLVVGKPWKDFSSCLEEGNTHENLFSAQGPCGRDVWMRINCKRTCGLCGLSLREALELPPRVGRKVEARFEGS